jgi:hypothetical protein
VQPRRECRLTPEGPDLAEELQKCFLHQIFRVRGISDHPKAQSVNAATVELVKMLEGQGVSGLRQADSLGFR